MSGPCWERTFARSKGSETESEQYGPPNNEVLASDFFVVKSLDLYSFLDQFRIRNHFELLSRRLSLVAVK